MHKGRQKALRARIIEQAIRLCCEHLRLREIALSQLDILWSAPEEIREPRGEFGIGERPAFVIGRRLREVEEHRRG